jgi:error-prone DNA polymerase
LESLAAADALQELSGDRHRAFWQASGVDARCLDRNTSQENAGLTTQMNFYSDLHFAEIDFGVDVLLPVVNEGQNIVADYGSTGFTLRRHPIALFRNHLNLYQVSPASYLTAIDNEAHAKVIGLVTCRQSPMTASGVTFITLEDESGFVNVVVWPKTEERLRSIGRKAMLIGVVGKVQKSDGGIHLIAQELVDLSHWLGSMELSSRNFT